jgi:hypothetical protein
MVDEFIQADNKEAGPLFKVGLVEETNRWHVLGWDHLPVDVLATHGYYEHTPGMKKGSMAMAAL